MKLTHKLIKLFLVPTLLVTGTNMALADGTFQFARDRYAVDEGNTVTLTVTRSNSSGHARVNFGTIGVTARHRQDYNGYVWTALNFYNGQSRKTIRVTTLSDNAAEGNETFGVHLSSPSSGYTLSSRDVSIVTIRDVSRPTTGDINLSWIAPATRTNGAVLSLSEIAGYRIYMGSTARNLAPVLDLEDGTLNRYVMRDLDNGTYYFAVTAYDTAGNESRLSNIAAKQTM
jgi:hypothetical protein